MQTHKKDSSEKLLTVLGDIKLFKWPWFMVYRPRSFAIKGHHTREVIKLVKPGDILVRSFNHYLNSYFIPGTFKHVGFYLGEVSEAHLRQFANIEHPNQFNPGKQRVIHTTGKQVLLEDLIDFCRCDGLAILRFPRKLKSLNNQQLPDILSAYFDNPTQPAEISEDSESEEVETEKPKKLTGSLKQIFKFRKKEGKKEPEPENEAPTAEKPAKPDATLAALVKAEKNIAQYIAQGKVIEFDKIFKILYRVAIRELSTSHDYDFGMDNFYATRCTELVYFMTKSLCWNYGIEAEPQRVFLKKRLVITPDMFVDAALEEVWKSDI